jgi:hypothetical protein
MNDTELPDDVLDLVAPLLRAAGAFARGVLPHAPSEAAARLAGCSEVVVSVRVFPTAAVCISGIGEAGPVRWDIALSPRTRDLN